MKPAILAIAIASTLLAASLVGIAAVLVTDATSEPAPAETEAHDDHTGPGADLLAFEGGHAGDGDHNGQPGMERPSFPEATGTTPTKESARSLEQVSRLRVHEDAEFTPANGVRSGNGTLADPYVITGYYVTGDLYIADTDACFIVKENYIGGQLTLNWNAQCVHVHHNYIEDLRVNENVRRTGYATGGLIELNKIEYIGQIRHYDGEFRNNVVGPRLPSSMFDEVLETVPWMFTTDPRVANVDGFNQGLFHHNTFYGSVDLDLHGHHHGTGFFAPHSHYHGGNMTKGMEHDHTLRWTSVAFTDNLVVDPEGYGIRYEDRNHRGDDRTANSEEEETLEYDHKHYTHIVIARNEVDKGQIWVDVFNADDENHPEKNPGWLEIVDNTIRFNERTADGPLGLPFFGPGGDWNSALHVNTAKEVALTIAGNHIELLPAEGDDDGVDLWIFDDGYQSELKAIYLRTIADSTVTLADNTFSGFYYGVYAERFDEAVEWTVDGNEYGDAQYPVYYDESVANEPRGNDV